MSCSESYTYSDCSAQLFINDEHIADMTDITISIPYEQSSATQMSELEISQLEVEFKRLEHPPSLRRYSKYERKLYGRHK